MGRYFLLGLGWISNPIVWFHRLLPLFPHMHILYSIITGWHHILKLLLVVSFLHTFSCTRVILVWCSGTCCLCQSIQNLLLELIWNCSQGIWLFLILTFLYYFFCHIIICSLLQGGIILLGLSFCGRISATNISYVTVFCLGTSLFFMKFIEFIPLMRSFSFIIFPMPYINPPYSLAPAVPQALCISGFLLFSRCIKYSIRPSSSSHTACA